MRLPQASSSMAIVESVTSVGGIAKLAPLALIRSLSHLMSSVLIMAVGWPC